MKLIRYLCFGLMVVATLAPSSAGADGAVAASREGRVGLSYNYRSQGAADERALEECGRGCRIISTFRRTCAAVATGERSGYGWATHENLRRAEESAVENCHREGGQRCRVASRGCDGRG